MPTVSLLFGILGWQYFTSLTDSLIPTPVAVSQAIIDMACSGELALHLWASFTRIVAGWLLGSLAGCLVGIVIGISRVAFGLILPWLALLLPVPKIALLPLFIILLGIGELTRILTIGFGVFLPTVFCVWQSMRSVPPTLIEMGKSFGLSRALIIRKIILPGILPGIFLSFRLTTAIALILLVSAEMLGAHEGIGSFILAAGSMAQLDKLFAGVIILGLSGLIMLLLWNCVEKHLVHWQKDIRLF